MSHTVAFRRLLLALQRARRDNLAASDRPAPRPFSESRRRFLQTAALTATGAITWSCGGGSSNNDNNNNNGISNNDENNDDSSQAPQVAIIGGGIAGLNAAYQLQTAGISATVYEAQSRLGGRMHTVVGAVAEGLASDLGAELINSDHEDMLSIASEFNVPLFDRVTAAADFDIPATAYYFDGRLVDEAELADDLRALAAQITADSERLDADWETVAPELDALSVRDYLDQYSALIPEPYIRTLMEAVIRSEYGVEPEQSSALELIFTLPTVDGEAVEVLGASDELYVVPGGTSRLIDALADALADQIQLNMAATVITDLGNRYAIDFANGEQVIADFVIVAIPFTALRDVILNVQLPEGLGDFIQSADLGRNEKVISAYQERVWRQPDGFVIEAYTDQSFAVVWDGSQRETERNDGALTHFFGGDPARTVVEQSTEVAAASVIEIQDQITPGAAAAATGSALRTRWGQAKYSQGAYTSFKPGQITQFADYFWIESDDPEERQEVHVGNLVFVGEHLSDAWYGFMNGGAETGRLAAVFVAARIGAS